MFNMRMKDLLTLLELKRIVIFAKMSTDMKKDVENKPIVIKNPSEKMKSFIKKMEEDKINRRQELLSTKNFTFSI